MNRQELIAAYALGELDPVERERFERELAADPALRAEVEATRGTMAHLEALPGDGWPGTGDEAATREPPEPAPREREADSAPAAASTPVADAAPRAGAAARRSGRARRPRHRLSLSPALAVAAIVVAAVLGGIVGALIDSGGDSSAPAKTVLVLRPLDAPKDSRADISMPKADTMLLRAHGLPPSAAGDYYEVWLMSSDEKLVPVASFRVGESGEASVEVPLPAAPDEYTYFDVSRQTVSGGTGHSADSVLRGPTSGLGA